MKYILVLLFSLALFGCSSNDELPDIAADAGEQQIYDDAQRYCAATTTTLLSVAFNFWKRATRLGSTPNRLNWKLFTRITVPTNMRRR